MKKFFKKTIIDRTNYDSKDSQKMDCYYIQGHPYHFDFFDMAENDTKILRTHESKTYT